MAEKEKEKEKEKEPILYNTPTVNAFGKPADYIHSYMPDTFFMKALGAVNDKFGQNMLDRKAAFGQDYDTVAAVDPLKRFKWQNVNVAKDNPYGQFNGKTFEETQQWQRDADEYNSAPRSPLITLSSSNASSGPSVSMNVQDAYTKPNVESEETRLMNTNRAIESQRRSSMAANQATVDAEQNKLVNKWSDEIFDATGKRYNNADLAANYEFNQSVAANFQRSLQKYLNDLGLYTKARELDYAMDAMMNNPAKLSTFISIFVPGAQVPDLVDAKMQEVGLNVFKSNYEYYKQEALKGGSSKAKADEHGYIMGADAALSYILKTNGDLGSTADSLHRRVSGIDSK